MIVMKVPAYSPMTETRGESVPAKKLWNVTAR